jgi:hypothetical protein
MGAARQITGPGASRPRWLGALAALAALALVACDKGPALSKATPVTDEPELPTPDLGPVRPELHLGALLDRTPIYAAASDAAPQLGYLHAGARVARSARAYENDRCTEGWYAVEPRGYVCTEKAATLDAQHPTLLAMSLQPDLEAALPYVYARTTKVTPLLENDGNKGVLLRGRVGKSTVMAIVGSWTAPDESREPVRLGLKLDGAFVRADDLVAAEGSSFAGLELDGAEALPVAFVVRRGVRSWRLEKDSAEKGDLLDYHARLRLTGRFRTIEGKQFYATSDERWVRHEDVSMVLARSEWPEFAKDGQKWLDVSIVTGTLVAYEGRRPVYTTLVSVGRDRLGEPSESASTARGTFRVVSKQITRRGDDSDSAALLDAPWALELESKQWLLASPRHDRFGIEHTDGDIEVSPADGAWLFRFAAPDLPKGWHGVRVGPDAPTTLVHVRK